MNNTSKKREFWEKRGALASNGGSDDYHLDLIERRLICERIGELRKILEIGCGSGNTLYDLLLKGAQEVVGIDFSSTFVEQAKAKFAGNINVRIFEMNIMNLEIPVINETFDSIISKRTLINLENFDEQIDVISQLSKLLNPGGKLLILENFNEGLEQLNALRLAWGLSEMKAPWHNRYFDRNEKFEIERQTGLTLLSDESVASTYYLLSRLLNAKEAANSGTSPNYDSEINFAAHNLPNVGDLGAPRLLIYQKGI